MRAIFTALFSQAARITAEISVDNRVALRAVTRMGFVYEGYCRLGFNGVSDTYVFGMLKDDCVYLPGYAGGTTTVMEMPDGQRVFSA
jgi:RimJ/RimL family protein N-acetyltransferase